MTIAEAEAQGITRLRLPQWNEHAYVELPPTGPWAYCYDVTFGIGSGEPIPTVRGLLKHYDTWEPVT